jgi:hypothetical protein
LREINVSTNKGENSLLNNLLKTPVKEKTKTMAHTTASKIWAREQIDTLYLPNDEGTFTSGISFHSVVVVGGAQPRHHNHHHHT